MRFVLAGSGHIAGVVNPPDKMKYQYWTGAQADQRQSRGLARQGQGASGSWWPDWLDGSRRRTPTEVPAREPGGGKLTPIEDAPGSYVKVRD